MSNNPEGSPLPVTGQISAAGLGLSEPGDIGPFRMRNAPDIAGYVAAAGTALGVGAVLNALVLGGVGDVAGFISLVGVILAVGLLVVLIIGLPLTLLAHVLLRRVESQRIHIAVFGLIGLVAGLLVGPLGGSWLRTTVLVALATGLSAALGRAVVNRRPR